MITTPSRAEALAFLGRYDHEGSSISLGILSLPNPDQPATRHGDLRTIEHYYGVDVYLVLQGDAMNPNASTGPRKLTAHFDGHGLNESLLIETDAPDPNAGGAAHLYDFAVSGVVVGRIQFQHGPRAVEGSTPGVTEAAVLAVLIDRLESFQAGPYACEENTTTLHHLDAALRSVKARADARAKRGVLGKNAV